MNILQVARHFTLDSQCPGLMLQNKQIKTQQLHQAFQCSRVLYFKMKSPCLLSLHYSIPVLDHRPSSSLLPLLVWLPTTCTLPPKSGQASTRFTLHQKAEGWRHDSAVRSAVRSITPGNWVSCHSITRITPGKPIPSAGSGGNPYTYTHKEGRKPQRLTER